MRSKKPFTSLHRFASRCFNAARNGFRWDLPSGIGIETSRACNRRCHYCPQSWSPKKQKIVSKETWDCFVFRLREAKYKGLISLTFYNEPSLIPNFDNYVRDVARIGCWPLIFTNADRPDQIEDWIRAGARRIVITEHPPYRPEWQIKAYALRKKHPWRVDVKKLDQLIWRTKPLSINGIPMDKCAFSGGMSIDVEGKVLMCCIDYECTTDMGNIHDTPLLDIWFSEKFANARKLVQSGVPALEMCKTCLTPCTS